MFTLPKMAAYWSFAVDKRPDGCAPQALSDRSFTSAVQCLRTELSPLGYDPKRVHRLARCLLCDGREELEAQAEWCGHQSRPRLLASLQVSTPLPAPKTSTSF